MVPKIHGSGLTYGFKQMVQSNETPIEYRIFWCQIHSEGKKIISFWKKLKKGRNGLTASINGPTKEKSLEAKR